MAHAFIPRPRFYRHLLGLGLVAMIGLATRPIEAKPRYQWEIAGLTKREGIDEALMARIEPTIRVALDKAIAKQPTLTTKGKRRRHRVVVEIVEASERVEANERKPGRQRLVVSFAVNLLGENVPAQTIAFNGDGRTTLKLDLGPTLQPADQAAAWETASETALEQAVSKALSILAR